MSVAETMLGKGRVTNNDGKLTVSASLMCGRLIVNAEAGNVGGYSTEVLGITDNDPNWAAASTG